MLNGKLASSCDVRVGRVATQRPEGRCLRRRPRKSRGGTMRAGGVSAYLYSIASRGPAMLEQLLRILQVMLKRRRGDRIAKGKVRPCREPREGPGRMDAPIASRRPPAKWK